ncbi:MAG: hypothetical protein ABEI78_02440 [Candidatus Nanohaloarchaea archaeon]
MVKPGWNQLHKETPVETFDKQFFTEAQVIESKLKRLRIRDLEDRNKKSYKVLIDIINYKTDFDSVIQQLLRNIYSVYQEAKEHDIISKAIYQLIEKHLRYYRKTNVDEHVEGVKNQRTGGNLNASGIEHHQIELLRTNMLRMLNTVKESLNNSNKMFKRRDIEDMDETFVYLAILARNFESSIKYYGAYKEPSDNEDDLMGVVDETATGEEEKAEEMLQEFGEEIQDTEDALDEVEKELEEL